MKIRILTKKKVYTNICASLNSLGDRTYWQQYRVHYMHTIKKKSWNTLNFIPSLVTCNSALGNIKSHTMQYTGLLRINSLIKQYVFLL